MCHFLIDRQYHFNTIDVSWMQDKRFCYHHWPVTRILFIQTSKSEYQRLYASPYAMLDKVLDISFRKHCTSKGSVSRMQTWLLGHLSLKSASAKCNAAGSGPTADACVEAWAACRHGCWAIWASYQRALGAMQPARARMQIQAWVTIWASTSER